MALSAAPQADDPIYQDPEAETYSGQPTTMVYDTVVQTRPTMSDHRIERKIHKAISRDVTMSNRALDVRVISKNGRVTLKGSVPTTMEKEKMLAKAEELVGSGNVIDQVKVKHPHNLG